mgnify:FL=1
MTDITMEDVKKLDCEICGSRMNYIRSDDNMTIMVYCDDKQHPEYEYDLTNDDHYFGNQDERME